LRDEDFFVAELTHDYFTQLRAALFALWLSGFSVV
jgi:hypothetical protein